jgi:N6-adenosine-specific RNA methylase IME4
MKSGGKTPEVMEKTFTILKQELNTEECLIYLQVITPRLEDATRELREKTAGFNLQDVFDGTRNVERGVDRVVTARDMTNARKKIVPYEVMA